MACAVATTALRALVEEGMVENAEAMGALFRNEMISARLPVVAAVRGRGLLNAVVVHDPAKKGVAKYICLRLMERGLLAKVRATFKSLAGILPAAPS